MELVQRILSKVVGEEISAEEMELVSGGRIDVCTSSGGYYSADSEGKFWGECDYQ